VTNANRTSLSLDALLQEQRTALREGRFEALASILQRLEQALISREPDHGITDAARLRSMAAENARLLRAAMAGLAEARNLRQRARGTTLTTYDASGRLSSQVHAGQTLSRR
jgi:flagellar biosynthesis/type III secretory pathway chaperone